MSSNRLTSAPISAASFSQTARRPTRESFFRRKTRNTFHRFCPSQVARSEFPVAPVAFVTKELSHKNFKQQRRMETCTTKFSAAPYASVICCYLQAVLTYCSAKSYISNAGGSSTILISSHLDRPSPESPLVLARFSFLPKQ